MKTRTKTEKCTFTFDKETLALFNRIAEITELSKIRIVTNAIKDFAQKKGISL